MENRYSFVKTQNTGKALNRLELAGLFGTPTFLNYIACQLAIPYLNNLHILPIEVCYFLSVGLLVLMPMFFGAIYLSGREIGSFKLKDILTRMRIKRLSRVDVFWTIGAFVVLSLSSFLIAKVIMPALGFDATPFFFQNMPLQSQNCWILYVWPLFFFLNIFGEEFLWRGYILPRQEGLNKKWTWLIHGLLWAFWHFPMGLDLVFAAIPIFFILPAVVQIRQNTSISIVIHAVFGGFGFLSLALGLVQ